MFEPGTSLFIFKNMVELSRLVVSEGDQYYQVKVIVGDEQFVTYGAHDEVVVLSAADRERLSTVITLPFWSNGTWQSSPTFEVPVGVFDDYEFYADVPYNSIISNEDLQRIRGLPGFAKLFAFNHGDSWYIIDNTDECGDPYQNSIGGYFNSYYSAMAYALEHYADDQGYRGEVVL